MKGNVMVFYGGDSEGRTWQFTHRGRGRSTCGPKALQWCRDNIPGFARANDEKLAKEMDEQANRERAGVAQ